MCSSRDSIFSMSLKVTIVVFQPQLVLDPPIAHTFSESSHLSPPNVPVVVSKGIYSTRQQLDRTCYHDPSFSCFSMHMLQILHGTTVVVLNPQFPKHFRPNHTKNIVLTKTVLLPKHSCTLSKVINNPPPSCCLLEFYYYL